MVELSNRLKQLCDRFPTCVLRGGGVGPIANRLVCGEKKLGLREVRSEGQAVRRESGRDDRSLTRPAGSRSEVGRDYHSVSSFPQIRQHPYHRGGGRAKFQPSSN
uniref:Uncharacterized protein n=1 Tax=Globodera rostochiensis TaxID=31243 RepID=A0A914H5B9_GLORO